MGNGTGKWVGRMREVERLVVDTLRHGQQRQFERGTEGEPRGRGRWNIRMSCQVLLCSDRVGAKWDI